jgi:putative ATP-dependent endonuclease of OLD family
VIPYIADLARELGFRVVALIDHDKAHHQTGKELDAVVKACDAVIRLPEKVAIEKATLHGMPMEAVRAASAAVTELLGIADPVKDKADNDARKALVLALHNSSFHEQLVEAIFEETGLLPPLVTAGLDALARAASAGYAGPSIVDLALPAVASDPTP